VDELGVYLLSFDRAGYGESDPNPKRDVKSEAMDIEELADQLEIGSKFYIVGVSMGGYPTWSCLNYIPHRQVQSISLQTSVCSLQTLHSIVKKSLVLEQISKNKLRHTVHISDPPYSVIPQLHLISLSTLQYFAHTN